LYESETRTIVDTFQLVYGLNATVQIVVASTKRTVELDTMCTTLRIPISISHSEPQKDVRLEFLSTETTKEPEKGFGTLSFVQPGVEQSESDSVPARQEEEEILVPETSEDGEVGYESDSSSVSSIDGLMQVSSSEAGDESDASNANTHPSDDDCHEVWPIGQIGGHSWHIRRNSTEEIDNMMQASELFQMDENLMTFIPDYVLKKVGVPLMMDYSTFPEGSKDHNLKSENTPEHIYILMSNDNEKIEILSMLDIEEEKTIIFCNTIEKVEWLATELRRRRLWPHTLVIKFDSIEQL
jgi:hypothetical protein